MARRTEPGRQGPLLFAFGELLMSRSCKEAGDELSRNAIAYGFVYDESQGCSRGGSRMILLLPVSKAPDMSGL